MHKLKIALYNKHLQIIPRDVPSTQISKCKYLFFMYKYLSVKYKYKYFVTSTSTIGLQYKYLVSRTSTNVSFKYK